MVNAETVKRVALSTGQVLLSLWAYSAAAEFGARRGIQAERKARRRCRE